jgi:hypothetical protein
MGWNQHVVGVAAGDARELFAPAAAAAGTPKVPTLHRDEYAGYSWNARLISRI